ncbi:MAG: NTP transferase domain-containing protein [Actinomycetota bacterium]|nr:NTP transferase domain-containing protein [Actinomycetota bacterium]
MKVAALVLAADVGSGFDRCKYLSRFRGTTLIEHVVGEVQKWPVDAVVVVLGPQAESILEATDFGESIIVIDLEWEEGEAAALRVGIDTLYRLDEFDTVVLIHADQTGSRANEVERLLDQHRSGHRPAVVPKYRYAAGHPVVIGDSLWPRLIGMEGSATFDQILQSHPDWVDEVWFDRLPVRRVHTPDDVADILELR